VRRAVRIVRRVYLPATLDAEALEAARERPGQFFTLAEAHAAVQLTGRPPSDPAPDVDAEATARALWEAGR
jgi:hypothetical protein